MDNISKLESLVDNHDFFSLIRDHSTIINGLPSKNIEETPKDLLTLFLNYLPYNNSNPRMELYLMMLINLLSKKKDFLRSYIIIFNELDIDELYLLKHLKDTDIEIIDKLDLDKPNNRFINHKIISTTFPYEILSFKENEKLYIDHLTSKNLISWPISKQDPIIEGQSQTGVKRFSKIILTSYGKSFSEFIFG
ncbi:hypothetical protein [Leptospira bandrabouensis]|uniref:DUF4393 domain-containing protein n=1 Tax=Leptospira bandrabouensis TaxID=2484903 RepID=A0A6H3NSV3_9LEPT|nr:hypothetical protein [Leptospira bandrabouensis]TGN13334.1 hypothetical protein EHR08_11680 [Leptospira bandrabouensis]